MQAMLLMDEAGFSFVNCTLWADLDTFAAADAGVGDFVSLRDDFAAPDGIAFPENRVDP